jgi:hypothetical protein
MDRSFNDEYRLISASCLPVELHYRVDMALNIKSLLFAPAPIFVLVAFTITRPSLGWSDVAISIGIALALSYGVLIAGLTLHLIICRFHRTDFASHLLAFQLALVTVIAVAAVAEGVPAPPLPNDNSPFAEMTVRNDGWIVLFLFGAPIVTVIAWIVWRSTTARRSDD